MTQIIQDPQEALLCTHEDCEELQNETSEYCDMHSQGLQTCSNCGYPSYGTTEFRGEKGMIIKLCEDCLYHN